MRKILNVALVLAGAFLFAPTASAQFTTVTATVQDPNGIPYAGAVLNAVLVPSTGGGYTLSGQPYSGRIGPVTLDSSGKFTVNFGDVTLITPGSPQWQITIDSAAATIGPSLGTGPQQFTFTSTGTTISGSSPVSLTTSLNALAPKLTNFASGGSGTISCSISAAVLFETAANTAGCAAGFTFSTPNLTLPTTGAYQLGGTNILSSPGLGSSLNDLAVGNGSPLGAITSGVNNVAVGPNTLTLTTSGQANTAVGTGALQSAGATNQKNTAVGHAALTAVTSDANTAVGEGALTTVTSGASNVAVGAGAGGLATGSNNTVVGTNAGNNLSTGSSNVIIGTGLGNPISSGNSNVAIGVAPMSNITITSSNQLDIMDVIIGTGMNVPATSGIELKGNLTIDGTCTGCGGAPAFSAITSGTNSAAAMVVGTGASLTTSGTGTIATTTQFTDSAAGAASVPAMNLTGTPFSGTGTTSVPLLYANGGTAPTTWSTAGTYFGVNAASGFTGNLIDFHLNGGNTLMNLSSNGTLTVATAITSQGNITLGAANRLQWLGQGGLSSPSNGVIYMHNTAVTGFTRLGFGGTTSSFPALQVNGANLQAELADGSAQTGWSAATYSTATNCSSSAAPAVCGSAAAGSVVIAATATTVTVNTTAVTANSQIDVGTDDTLGTKLSVTCNSTLATLIGGLAITARTAGTSFQITSGATPAVNPLCISYHITN